MYFYQTTSYWGCWNDAKDVGGSSLKLVDCKSPKWRSDVAKGWQLRGRQPACRR